MKDEDKALAHLLQQDATRIKKTEAFDAKLHQDTVRRICHLNDFTSDGSWKRLKLPASLAMAAATCAIVFLILRPPTSTQSDPELGQLPEPPPASALAYRQALADGEGALLAMLDRDARLLLPQSPPVFLSPR